MRWCGAQSADHLGENAENRGDVGEVVCVLGTSVSVVVAVLAAGPLCWQHEPFHAQLNPIGGMVGSLPKPPPIGLTCASMGPGVHLPGLGHHLSGQRAGHRARVRRMRSQKQKRDTRLTGLPTLPMPPRRRRRRNPEGSRPSLRAVAAPSVPKSHPTSNT